MLFSLLWLTNPNQRIVFAAVYTKKQEEKYERLKMLMASARAVYY
jgi:hypothetical protein